ncbi:hypothetical protein FOXG_10187 [Fusarium oxysporum f. sp. lycopersici 4287]|uniref:ATPase AAA-type core domain-containing protein n=2 Tax=Fusarium oxysporum TaxID=5507 RepID=A0A0J9VFC5_FUSO4|nr:hypothetical protein FOXG_10187 [Fusarium oxysporum f. sp. lycopersici 4287]KNB09650.1 hypothetical protein FOXG_10187 [Fusarium oxysporum f. sp. lycopersici 4287]
MRMGLILLLAGPPGVGKTLTAESDEATVLLEKRSSDRFAQNELVSIFLNNTRVLYRHPYSYS